MGWLKSPFAKTSPAASASKTADRGISVGEWIAQAAKSVDFHQFSPVERHDRIRIRYFRSLVNTDRVTRLLLPAIQQHIEGIARPGDLLGILPFDEVSETGDVGEIEKKLMKGFVLLQLMDADRTFILVNVNDSGTGHRQNNETSNEFSVVGPKVGFVENIETNLHLLRQKIALPSLVLEQITIGSISKTKVVVAHLDGVTNPEYIRTVKQRLASIDFDVVFDSSFLDQIISDNSNSPFPLFTSTERVDRAVYAIISGQIAILSDGSPYAVLGPSNLLEFFISPEDYYLSWTLGSFFRVIRMISVVFSILATSIYVAVMTYHFEVIPEHLLGPLIHSRTHVPFPPVMEAIFLEITIELLREAGARLPSKIGQTLGIVGGIVIGQASVEAALTSSILLIIVALSALASFTTPIFKMANTIRLLRFPFILLAAAWGGFGIVMGLLLLLGHLLRLKSLGMPYLVPLFPFRIGSYADSFIRSSYQYTTNRSRHFRPLSMKRYEPSEDKEDIRHE